ncbi:hypothetical protein [Flavobacterium hercynium]|nr:hypothetical protein [Flavobacterium hercynium]SMP36635.1 hypothetical protein SAMN06265346_12332 [Flavobacterium hercynium]
MKAKIIFIISVISLISCNKPKLEKTNVFYFNLYNNKDIEVESNIFTLERRKLNLFDSIIVFKKNEKVLSFKETFDKEGIYRYVLNKKTLTHSLKDSITLTTNYNVSYFPFVNKKATLINKVIYKLGENSYKIFHYSELQNNHRSFDSYYLENFGFICYYNFDTDKYVLCDSTNIKSLKIKEITSRLVKDKTFFARFTVAKLFPNYYGENNSSKRL